MKKLQLSIGVCPEEAETAYGAIAEFKPAKASDTGLRVGAAPGGASRPLPAVAEGAARRGELTARIGNGPDVPPVTSGGPFAGIDAPKPKLCSGENIRRLAAPPTKYPEG